jgi:hypothetical protein
MSVPVEFLFPLALPFHCSVAKAWSCCLQQIFISQRSFFMTSLRQRMTEDMQIRNLSSNTQTSYLHQVTLFARYFKQSPELLGPEAIRSYQVYLTNERKLAVGSILIAIAALRFLYKITLKKEWDFGATTASPKRRAIWLQISSNLDKCSWLLSGLIHFEHRA